MSAAAAVTRMIRSARYLGLTILLVAVPLSLSASTLTIDFNGTLNSLPVVGSFTYNPADIVSGASGVYTDPGDGLESLSLTYNSVDYTNLSASLLGGPTLPTVFLPGDTTITNGLPYDVESFWVVSGTCSGGGGIYVCTGPGGFATVLGMARTINGSPTGSQIFLASNITSVDIFGSGDSLGYELGGPTPPVQYTSGTINETPEPGLISLMALGLAGLILVRTRKAILS
jgi:hypothetical protein